MSPWLTPAFSVPMTFLTLALPSPAGAQDPRAYNVTTGFDQYGNARSSSNPWTSARYGLYGAVSGAAPWDYVSVMARSVGRPPQFSGGMAAGRTDGLVGRVFDHTFDLTAGGAAAGFGRYSGGGAAGGLAGVAPRPAPLAVPDLPVLASTDVTRQLVMVRARFLMAVSPPDVGARGAEGAGGGGSADQDGGVAVGGAPQFYQSLAAALYQQVRARAWAAFREGDFAGASYELQTALSLTPGDRESRLGLLFCDAGAERFLSAQAQMASIIGREGDDALTRSVAFGAQFGTAEAYARTRDRLQRFVMTRRGDLESVALLTFFLWHAGAERDAIQVADQIAQQRPGSRYAAWSAAMRRQMTRPDAAPPTEPA